MGRIGSIFLTVLFSMFFAVCAQSGEMKPEAPPVGQPLVREGDFALKLVDALKIGAASDEVEAESMMGEAGVAPRNGWIADYPVTPDIVGELRGAVADAADGNRLSMRKDEALKAFNDASADLGFEVKTYTSGATNESEPSNYDNYPNPSVVNNYYYNEGPPVVTYYQPPPNYYYMYSWVPYPFWWYDFWFPGFFILNDFHRVVIINKRVVVVTNHFNDPKTHRVHRIDPVRRYSGRTFAGIGALRNRGFISTGVPRSAETIFNRRPERGLTGGARVMSPPVSGGRVTTPPTGRGEPGRSVAPARRGGGRAGGPSPRGGDGGIRR